MQQINLYQPIFRKEQKIFSARNLLLGNLLVLLGLIALYGTSYWQGLALNNQLAQTIKQRSTSLNRVTQLAKEYPEKQRDPRLASTIERARARLSFLTEISKTLSSKGGGVEGGFSEYLTGLSRQDGPQLWLEQITILGGGSEIRLRGLATESRRVPHYIQRLGREPVFQGTSFHRLSIGRQPPPDEHSSLIRFTLETSLNSLTDNSLNNSDRWAIKGSSQIPEEMVR